MAPALPDDLSKLTVAKLKDALKKRGLDVAGLKADLVARLQSAVDAENKAGPGSPKSPPTSKSPRQSKGAGDEDGKSPRTSTREPSPERKSLRASGGKGGKRKRDSEPSAFLLRLCLGFPPLGGRLALAAGRRGVHVVRDLGPSTRGLILRHARRGKTVRSRRASGVRGRLGNPLFIQTR